MSYTPSQKIAIIKEVMEDKHSVYSVCKKYNLSKMSFYKWLAIYKKARKNRHVSLESNIKEGSDHYKSLSFAKKYKVLAKVHSNPELSCHQIAQNLGLGNHAVQNVLEKEGLNLVEQRVEYGKKPFWKRETAQRRQGMMELYEQGWQIDSICRHYKISKTTFFKWRQRYLEAKELGRLLALGDRYVSGSVHHKYIDESVKDKVVELVAQNPAWSVHKIAASVAQTEGKPVIGHHAIQDLLLKRDLNTMEKRRLYAQGFVRQLAPAIQIYETPVPSLTVWRLLYAPFKTVPKWVFKHPATWPVVFPATIFLAWIIEVDKLFNPVFLFPTIALTFGMFFFLYSLKYYFSLIMVMKVVQGGEGVNNPDVDVKLDQGPQSFAMRIANIIGKSIKISQPISKVNPLALNFSKVELASKPFVSIHAPIYNEKRVVERLISACSAQNWVDETSGKANFEVILVDDSTDTTTEIVKQKLAEDGRKLTRSVFNDEVEMYVSETINGPTIKLIHRFNRNGYKGAALGNAMNYIDSRAQYVTVFDADFVPYPDTIEQFMKSFQEACGGLENVADSKIAAVQGYQWHVLNKSENWVTRGVRTEYAGSYVVERAGIGIYGGLNQIAGSVFCIRADVLRAFGWQTSITEDLQLTLRLYEQGFKVVFNPYIQAPAEAVSTVKRLIRQRMRWAEGHTFNVKHMWLKMMYSKRISTREKFEFLYLAPYYLQAAFFLIGVTCWFISEVIVHSRLPFWTAAWGWSLVFTNFLALPLMNLAGLFLEESSEKDYVGVASFMLLSYIVVPFQAYAAVKALFETEEGPWFRTPKTGLITDNFDRGRFYGWIEKLKMFGGVSSNVASTVQNIVSGTGSGFGGGLSLARVSAHNSLSGYRIIPRRAPRVSRAVIASLAIVVLFLNSLAFLAPPVKASTSPTSALEQQLNIMDFTSGNIQTSTYTPTDDINGVVNYDSNKYDGTVLTYFEAVAKVAGAEGNVGQHASIKCISTTDCVMVYYDVLHKALKWAYCNSANCSSPTITIIDGVGCVVTGCSTTSDVGQYASVDCWNATSSCSVSWYDATNGDLKFVDCTNTSCTTTDGLTGVRTLDSAGDVGAGTSIKCALAPSQCAVAYTDTTNTALKFIQCSSNDSCGSPTIYNVDGVSGCVFTSCSATATVGQYPSLSVIDSTGLAVFVSEISYYDAGNGDLKFARCSETTGTWSCAGSTKVGLVEHIASTTVGQYTSIFCPTYTDCKIAHYDATNGDLRFFDCDDQNCSTGTGRITDGRTGCTPTNCNAGTDDVGKYTSIYCVSATDCKISYYDATSANLNLKFADCDDATCNTGTVSTPYTTGDVGQYTSLTCVGGSTACQIIYYDATSTKGDLVIYPCTSSACASGVTPTKVDVGTGGLFTAGLFASGSQTAVSGSEVTFSSTSYARARSGAITLTTGTDYTVRYKTDGIQTGTIRASRVIITQTNATKLTKTEAQVEVGDKQAISINGFTDIGNKKFYCYDGDVTCAANSTSIWNPAPTVYFEATIQNTNASTGVTDAELFDITANAAVASSPITLTGASATTYTRVRSSSITLTAGHQYKVKVSVANFAGNISNAKIILDQSSTSGISATEVVETYNNTKATGVTTAYVSQNYPNLYTQNHFAGTGTWYLDTTLYFSGKTGTTAYAQFSNSTGAVSTAATTATFIRANAGEPADATALDVQLKADTQANSNVTNLVIQLTAFPVPESSLLLLPLVLTLPFIVRRLRLSRKNTGFLEVGNG